MGHRSRSEQISESGRVRTSGFVNPADSLETFHGVRASPHGRVHLRRDRCQQLFGADNIDDARQIVSEHAQRHLGRNFRQRHAQEVRRAHAHLQC